MTADDSTSPALSRLIDWLRHEPSDAPLPSPDGSDPMPATVMAEIRAMAERVRAQERARVARHLNDTVVRRAFALGLAIESAAQRPTDDAEAFRQLVDGTDAIIREARAFVFRVTHDGED